MSDPLVKTYGQKGSTPVTLAVFRFFSGACIPLGYTLRLLEKGQ